MAEKGEKNTKKSLDLSGGSAPDKAEKMKYNEEYRQKRIKNNMAVKKSRQNSLLKQLQRTEMIKKLKIQNEELAKKERTQKTELRLLKGLFSLACGTSKFEVPKSVDLKKLLSDESKETGSSKPSTSSDK